MKTALYFGMVVLVSVLTVAPVQAMGTLKTCPPTPSASLPQCPQICYDANMIPQQVQPMPKPIDLPLIVQCINKMQEIGSNMPLRQIPVPTK